MLYRREFWYTPEANGGWRFLRYSYIWVFRTVSHIKLYLKTRGTKWCENEIMPNVARVCYFITETQYDSKRARAVHTYTYPVCNNNVTPHRASNFEKTQVLDQFHHAAM